MSALKAAGSTFPAPRIGTRPPFDTWESHTARSVTHWGPSGAVISVVGELDAANAGQLADYVEHCAGYCQWLILDLNDLEFIGTAGFSALRTITDRCAESMIHCTTVPGDAVSRLLRVCDPNGALPTTASVSAALADVPGLRQVT
jgi:anti-anti-sigma factor